jgi:hypothetical protein
MSKDHPDREDDGKSMQPRGLRNDEVRQYPQTTPKITLQQPLQRGLWQRLKYSLHHGGRLTLMAEDGKGQGQARLSIPYPLVAAMVALFIWIAGASIAAVWSFASMSRDLNNLQNSFTNQIIRDAEERKKMQEEYLLMQTYLQNDRERLIKLEAQKGRSN